MGLSARRQKQRIPKDPRNLGWVDGVHSSPPNVHVTLMIIYPTDAARFGQSYLSKLGWDPSKGLGIAGTGRTDHIKVVQKQDTLGIGVSRGRDLDGTAWKQNTDFEDVLRRLNATTTDTPCQEDVAEETTETRDESHVEKGRTMEDPGEDGARSRKKKRKTSETEASVSKSKSKRRKEKEKVENLLSIPSSTSTSAKILPRRA